MALLLVSSAFGAADRVTVGRDVTVHGQTIRLGEVAALEGERARALASLALGTAPGAGESRTLDGMVVLQALQREVDLDSITMPVVWFNLGVEFGQIAILLVVFPVLAWIRRSADEPASERRQRLLVRIGSAPILLLGLGWMIDRIFQLEMMPF